MAQMKEQNRDRPTDTENRLVVAKRESGVDWESGFTRCKLLPLEWISNEILLYSGAPPLPTLVSYL